MAEWTNLPDDILKLIFDRLVSAFDRLRFRSICSAWRSSSASVPDLLSGVPRFLPNSGIARSSLGFCLCKRTIYLLQPSPDSRKTNNSIVWLAKIEQDNPQTKVLLSPLSRHRVNFNLGSFPKSLNLMDLRVSEVGEECVLKHVGCTSNRFHDLGSLYIEKVATLWLERENIYVLLTIHVSGRLAIFSSFNRKWSVIPDMPSPYDDVIVYEGKLYAVDSTGSAVIVAPDKTLEHAADAVFGGDKKYFVDSCGELLLVDMYITIHSEEDHICSDDEIPNCIYMSEKVVTFKVYKLNECLKMWTEMNNIGNRVLFLGDDSSFSVMASDLPGSTGNCIVFVNSKCNQEQDIDDESEFEASEDNRDISVFELDTGKMDSLESYPQYLKMFLLPFDWFPSIPQEL